MVSSHRQRQRDTHARVLLQIVALHAVEGRAPARVVGSIHCTPHTATEVVDEVPLEGVNGILRTGVAAEKVIVGRVEGDAGGEVQCQGTRGLCYTQVWLDRPPARGLAHA